MLSSEGRKVQSSNRLEYHRQFILCLLRLSVLQHTPPEGSSSSSQFCAANLEGFGGRDKGSSVHLFSMKPAITCLLRMLSLLSQETCLDCRQGMNCINSAQQLGIQHSFVLIFTAHHCITEVDAGHFGGYAGKVWRYRS